MKTIDEIRKLTEEAVIDKAERNRLAKTQTAWLVHLCDGISARMNDCDRLDLVHGKPKGAQ